MKLSQNIGFFFFRFSSLESYSTTSTFNSCELFSFSFHPFSVVMDSGILVVSTFFCCTNNAIFLYRRIHSSYEQTQAYQETRQTKRKIFSESVQQIKLFPPALTANITQNPTQRALETEDVLVKLIIHEFSYLRLAGNATRNFFPSIAGRLFRVLI